MRYFASAVVLFLSAAPAFARDLPEPETLPLIAVGAVGLLFSLRKKKK